MQNDFEMIVAFEIEYTRRGAFELLYPSVNAAVRGRCHAPLPGCMGPGIASVRVDAL